MLLLFILLTLLVSGQSEERSVFGKLKSGFELTRKLLGIDHASSVAQLVTEAFGKTHKKGDGSEAGGNIFSGFLRVLGFDAKKIGAIAVNAIIFVAQLISSSLSRPLVSQMTEARKLRKGTPFDWMMDNAEVADMISHVKDHELPNHIITHIRQRSMDEETDCLQLLICKTAPFIWGMQKALSSTGNTTVKGPKALYAYLPSVYEVGNHGDTCDQKHQFCFIDV